MATSYSNEEKERLVNMFESLEVKPKMDNTEELKTWMADYVKGQGRLEHDVGPDPNIPVAGKATHIIQMPRLVPFSGSGDQKEISYESWRFEVLTLLNEGTHSPKEVETAAKKSLRGEASNIVRRLGIDADIDMVIFKLDGIYGLVEDAEQLLSQFYSAKQKQGEKVSSWGCRIEDLLDRANRQEPLHAKSMNDMLRKKFWNGLLPKLRESSRSKTEHIKEFNKLMVAVRMIECEQPDVEVTIPTDTRKAQVKMAKAEAKHESESEMEILKGVVCQLTTKLDELQGAIQSRSKPEGKGYNQNPSWSRGRGNRGRGGYRGKPHWKPNKWSGDQYQHNTGNHANPNDKPQDVICYRCKQEGHIALGCRVDLSKLPLNE